MSITVKWEKNLSQYSIDELRNFRNTLLTIESHNTIIKEYGKATLLRKIIEDIITNKTR